MRKFGVVAVVLCLGCQDYPFKQVCPNGVEEAELIRPAFEPKPADVLFVVDNSGSMLDDQQRLAASFDRFINEIAGKGDYQLAVVTTDLDSPGGEKEGAVAPLFSATFPFPAAYPGISDRRDCRAVEPELEHGCFRGPDPDRRIVTSALPPEEQIATFRQNFVVGSCGSGKEQGLKAMSDALALTDPGECNAGFLRPDANLVVVFVSDEEDADATALGTYVDALVRAKGGEARKVRVATIVGSIDGEASRCSPTLGALCGASVCEGTFATGSGAACRTTQNDCSPSEVCAGSGVGGTCQTETEVWIGIGECASCSTFDTEDCCAAGAGGRYVAFARGVEDRVRQDDQSIVRTGCQPSEGNRTACVVDTICQENYGDTLARIANDLIIPDVFDLKPPAVNPAGVLITMSGGRYGAGTTLQPGVDYMVATDGESFTVSDRERLPQAGTDEALEVYYVSEVTGDEPGGRGACAR